MPSNPEAEVTRKKYFLWESHRSLKQTYAILGVAIVVSYIGGSFLHTRLMDIPASLYVFALLYGGWTHHRLAPWCPYCRGWDDGGPEELVPDPDPSEANVIK